MNEEHGGLDYDEVIKHDRAAAAIAGRIAPEPELVAPPPIRQRERRMMTRPQILLRARRWEQRADALALIVAGLHWWQGRAGRREMRQAELEIRARADELRHVLNGYGMAKAEKGEQK